MKKIRNMEKATMIANEIKEEVVNTLKFLNTRNLPDFEAEVKEWRPTIMEVVIRKSKDYPFTNAPFLGGTIGVIKGKVDEWADKYGKIYMVAEAYIDKDGIPQPQISIKVGMVEW